MNSVENLIILRVDEDKRLKKNAKIKDSLSGWSLNEGD